MTKNTAKAEQNDAAKGPDYIAFHVREGEQGKGFWTRIGAAWKHKDGEGLNLQLDLVPVAGGRIVLRFPKDDDAQEK
ncbi:MAG: hypothetical protein AB7S70_00360 [Hyphomicrobium sp.]|uniref:hypothetical protein n=1 Tax=Hyphomicrobium sp. TaxID=82 RepID=UPI003D139BAA